MYDHLIKLHGVVLISDTRDTPLMPNWVIQAIRGFALARQLVAEFCTRGKSKKEVSVLEHNKTILFLQLQVLMKLVT